MNTNDNPYGYNSMLNEQIVVDPIYKACALYDGECKITGNTGKGCEGETACRKPGQKCFTGKKSTNLLESEQDAIDKCKENIMKPPPGKVKPIGGKTNNGPSPGPTPGPGDKNFWNSTSGIITIIAICLGIALLLVGITYAVTKRKTVKK